MIAAVAAAGEATASATEALALRVQAVAGDTASSAAAAALHQRAGEAQVWNWGDVAVAAVADAAAVIAEATGPILYNNGPVHHLDHLPREDLPRFPGEDIPRDVMEMLGCEGSWCGVIERFNALFDTNDPSKMQQALDAYTEWPRDEMGIAIAVTKDHYYEMYHKKIEEKMGEYLPQGLFGWTFGEHYKLIQEPSLENGMEAVIVREGTMTVALGWFRRKMLWEAVVKPMPRGHTFPFSTARDFEDCDMCPAEIVYTLRLGGVHGAGDTWAITGLSIVKLV